MVITVAHHVQALLCASCMLSRNLKHLDSLLCRVAKGSMGLEHTTSNMMLLRNTSMSVAELAATAQLESGAQEGQSSKVVDQTHSLLNSMLVLNFNA